MKNFWRALLLLPATAIGAGMFTLPYFFAQAGAIPSLISIIFLGLTTLLINLFYGAIILKNKKYYQFPIYVGFRMGKKLEFLATIILIIALAGALLTYAILGINFLDLFLSSLALNKFWGRLIFFSLALAIFRLGLKRLSFLEAFLTSILGLATLLIIWQQRAMFQKNNLTLFNSNPFAAYGPLLFAFSSFTIIPEVYRLLNRRHFFLAITLGTILIVFIYFLYGFGFWGLLGPTPELNSLDQFVSLFPRLRWLGASLGFLSCFTSFAGLGAVAIDTLGEFIPLNLAKFFLLAFFSLSLFASERWLGTIISLTGGVAVGTMGVLIAFLYWRQTKQRWRRLLSFIVALALLIGIFATSFFPYLKAYLFHPDPSWQFLEESVNIIQKNYWQKLSREQAEQFLLSVGEKLSNRSPASLKGIKTKDKLRAMLRLYPYPKERKKFVINLLNTALLTLPPRGRSRLYRQKDEKILRQRLKNISQKNLYQVLKISPQASRAAVVQAYRQQLRRIRKLPPLQAKQKKKTLHLAYQTLTNQHYRQRYNQSKITPAVEYYFLGPNIFYLHLKKISLNLLEDLKEINSPRQKLVNADNLILDLRDNVGGAIDLLPYLLGFFIGRDQLGYRFFHQGQKINFFTKTNRWPLMSHYRQVVILINGKTQSSAEILAASLKLYHLGPLVGTPSRGWGTVERVFPLKSQLIPGEHYSIFLVHSLTLDENQKPIEGRGIKPNIDIRQREWPRQLFRYCHNPELVAAVKNLLAGNPASSP